MSRRALALAAATLACATTLVGAGCGERKSEAAAPAEGGPAARLVATADHGAEVLLDESVAPGRSVMDALQGVTPVETAYGGGFVSSMLGRGSSSSPPTDWFFYVNGFESPVGARAADLEAGDVAWWDHRAWQGMQSVRAVVGAWPEPFVSGAGGTRPTVAADAPLAGALRTAGARVGGGARAFPMPAQMPEAYAAGAERAEARAAAAAPDGPIDLTDDSPPRTDGAKRRRSEGRNDVVTIDDDEEEGDARSPGTMPASSSPGAGGGASSLMAELARERMERERNRGGAPAPDGPYAAKPRSTAKERYVPSTDKGPAGNLTGAAKRVAGLAPASGGGGRDQTLNGIKEGECCTCLESVGCGAPGWALPCRQAHPLCASQPEAEPQTRTLITPPHRPLAN